MIERKLSRLAQALARRPDDLAGWIDLARLLAASGRTPADLELEVPAAWLLEAWAREPHARALGDLVLPAIGWRALADDEAPPPPRWRRLRRLGRAAGHSYDRATGMPLAVRVLSLGLDLRWVPPGRFLQGTPPGEDLSPGMEQPTRRVTIPRGLYVGRVPVTQGQYRRVTRAKLPGPQGKQLPAAGPSWRQAVTWCQKLTRRERRNRGFPATWSYRLPSESEWEYACRAGSTGLRPGPLDEVAWYRGNAGDRAHPVGGKQANDLGLHDMLGNVREWCLDTYVSGYEGAPRDGSARSDGYAAHRVCRGGYYDSGPFDVRSAARDWPGEDRTGLEYGLRCVASPTHAWAQEAERFQQFGTGAGVDLDDPWDDELYFPWP